MKVHIKNYLSITKKEWNGLVIFVILIAGVLTAPEVYQTFHKDKTINFKDFNDAAAQLRRAGYTEAAGDSVTSAEKKGRAIVMFPFNPNTLDTNQWKALGLSGRQALVIEHYVAKGGRFYRKEDLKKIYSITAADYRRLEPYITIPEEEYAANKLKAGEAIELNTADSAAMTRVKGIGPYFAVRIIRYRNRLGGFFRKGQLKEIAGVDSLKYAEIQGQVTVNPALIKKLSINTISVNQLLIFPYLRYNQANAIIQYRSQHGKYRSVNDMKNIAILDDEILSKLEPYLSFK